MKFASLTVYLLAARATVGAQCMDAETADGSLREARNESADSSTSGLEEADAELRWMCVLPKDGLSSWYYATTNEGPYRCTKQHDGYDWAMLNAYRVGGKEGVHWKYTNNDNDGACLFNWKYYTRNGKSLISTVNGRTTTLDDTRKWCALPVYQPGGVKGKQWARCPCL